MTDSPDSQKNDPIFDKYPEDSEDRSNTDTNPTPNSELSPPTTPINKEVELGQKVDPRTNARKLAATLSLEEQVHTFQPQFYFSKSSYSQ